ncbi:MAG: DinB family protein [Chloroflexota bacterium]
MLGKEMLLKLYDHSYWVTDRILTSAAKISEADFIGTTDHSHGSLRDTLVHTFYYEWSWRLRCQGEIPSVASFEVEDFPNVEMLQEDWLAEEKMMRKYLNALSEDDLQEEVTVETPNGEAYQLVRWHMLTHVTVHGMQHRSEAATMLTNLGQSPGGLDLIAFLYSG